MPKAKEYVILETYLLEMPDDELQGFRGEDYSVTMRSLLLAEYKHCNDLSEQGEPVPQRTMRNLWYRYIKPVLSRAGLLDEDNFDDFKVPKWDKKLSDILAELVRDGEFTYEDLSIFDGSRQRQVAASVSRPLHDTILVGSHYPGLSPVHRERHDLPDCRESGEHLRLVCDLGGWSALFRLHREHGPPNHPA